MANETDYSGYGAWKQWNVLFRPDRRDVVQFDREFAGQTLEGRKLLDIGFGNGSLLAWARSKGAVVEGVEVQPELRLAAQGAGIGAWRTLDEITHQKFELVTLFDVAFRADPLSTAGRGETSSRHLGGC